VSGAVATAFASALTRTRGGLSLTAIRSRRSSPPRSRAWPELRFGSGSPTPQFDEVPDAVFGEPIHSGIGFELQTEARLFGPPPDAFGHTGAGGSAHGYWPSEGVAFSFAINELQNEADDRRCRDVLTALHSELGAAG
jgi:hypothetical protein